MPRALLSVSDKAGIEPFARGLVERGWTLLSTGGTAAALRSAGLPVTLVEEVTGHPEVMDGRVKTLHPAVHGGLLARADHPGDDAALRRLGYEYIDLLAVNLYPFRETVARGAGRAEAVEQIDIGGPAMLRAAAKNHGRVWPVVDPGDYERVLGALDGGEGDGLRLRLAAKAFAHTAGYDAAIAAYLGSGQGDAEAARDGADPGEELPVRLELSLERVQTLRYGENPDQRAALYAPGGEAGFRQLQGKELSFNNLVDLDAALLAVSAWEAGEGCACAIVKHATPCGIALGGSPAEAFSAALATDPTSAFGSVIALNAPVDAAAAGVITTLFVEALVAPAYTDEALHLLAAKKNLRLVVPGSGGALPWDLKSLAFGAALQERLSMRFPEDDWRVVTEREPTDGELSDLRFAWRAVATVKSNAILLARGRAALGIGGGRTSRVHAARQAIEMARENGFETAGAVLASDAFFPFRDGIDAAAAAGVTAIIQPGGSVRDEEVIAAADSHGIAMLLTGRRLFRH